MKRGNQRVIGRSIGIRLESDLPLVNVIDSYRFGSIVVSGKRYTSDVIIYPDRVSSGWQRMKGHRLCLKDIAEVIAAKPEVLIVGTGTAGLMKVLPEAEQVIREKGIKLIAKTTDDACRLYNELCHSQKVAAALHITC